MSLIRKKIGLFLFGERGNDAGASPFKNLTGDMHTSRQIVDLMALYPEDSPVLALLNETNNFLSATSLKFAEIRNNNPGIDTIYCQAKLHKMADALSTAKKALFKEPLKLKELNDAIGYCEKTIQKRLDELSPEDKYSKAYNEDKNRALQSALEPPSTTKPQR